MTRVGHKSVWRAALKQYLYQGAIISYNILHYNVSIATAYGHHSIYYLVDLRQCRAQQRSPDPQHTLITLPQVLSGGEGQSDLLLQPGLHHKDGGLRQAVCPKLWSKSI